VHLLQLLHAVVITTKESKQPFSEPSPVTYAWILYKWNWRFCPGRPTNHLIAKNINFSILLFNPQSLVCLCTTRLKKRIQNLHFISSVFVHSVHKYLSLPVALCLRNSLLVGGIGGAIMNKMVVCIIRQTFTYISFCIKSWVKVLNNLRGMSSTKNNNWNERCQTQFNKTVKM
jgi:hypothetical protein